MADIFTTDVRADVQINGVNISPTSVEVSRTIGPSAGTCTIKGYSDNPSALELNQTAKVYMGTDTDTGQSVRKKIFQGEVKKATRNEEALITIECYDERINLHGKTVKYTNEEPLNARSVLYDVINESGYDPTTSYSLFDYDSPTGDKRAHIPAASDIPGTPTVGKHAYGSGRRGEPVRNVLADLATKLGCRFWVDKNNFIRIRPYPKSRKYEAKYITEIESGDETVNQTKVLVQGGTPVSEAGPAAANIYNQTRIQSDSESDAFGDREFKYYDDNVITQEEADRAASSNQYDREVSRNVGEVTIVGNPQPTLFDVVTVPELRQSDAYDTNSENQCLLPSVEQSYDSEFAITGIKHVVDVDNGYETTLELGPEPGQAAESLSGISGAIADELLDDIEANIIDEGSPLNFLPGFE